MLGSAFKDIVTRTSMRTRLKDGSAPAVLDKGGLRPVPDTSGGFTLIELLIVVAIIAILAAIAVPNFLEAQVRSKVARTSSDMRTLATALESYRVDNNGYPYVTNYFPQPYSVPGSHHLNDPERAQGLTTPVAYVTSIPRDPFGGVRDAADLYIVYAADNYYFATKAYFEIHNFPWRVQPGGENSNPSLWVLQSKGPDRAWARSVANGGSGTWELDQPYVYKYDPSNGTISSGNIVRSGP